MLQPTLKRWNSNTSQKLLATTCFNPICTSDNSLCPEDALASSLRKISNFSWFSLFTFAAKLFRSFVGITMAEAFYILIGFLIMAAIIVMAVLYLENHS
ncbi:small membrane protein YldA [Escherichia coli]